MINSYYPNAFKRIRAAESKLGITSNNLLHIQMMDEKWGSGNPNAALTDLWFAFYDDHSYVKWTPNVAATRDAYMRFSCHDDRGGNWPVIVGEWSLSPADEDNAEFSITKPDAVAWYRKWWAAQVIAYEKQNVKKFRKAKCPIVERLANSLMMHGRNNGKKVMTVRIVKHAFEIINLLTDANPIQVLVDAVQNTGPREDSTRIGSQGTVRRQAVDVSPLRRVNQAIHLLTTGAREAAFRNVKTIAECLADELINAAKGSSNSYAIKKKDELERVAKSNR
ncbi:ribosomal protein S5 [Kappamyces sp. JEL0829]|nr:ribosomal protein S5 [Kappamyces sp. JEL0829]